jgi:SAM-dependent MidA family methyltransferase
MVTLRADRLAPGLGPVTPYPALSHRVAETCEGDVVETCPAAAAIAGEIGRRVARRGGAALVVDYGGWRSLGDTFQALKGHAPADPFAEPGEADLTAHVDFQALALAFAAEGAAVTAMTPQGVFLERLGIAARAEVLARGLAGEPLRTHLAAHRRLTHPDEMGQLFKVIAAYPQGEAPPPGLDPAG